MLPTDDEARYAVLEALYDQERSGGGGLSFDQLHDKLYISWPILWFNLDYLEEEQLIIHRKQERTCTESSRTYEITEKGQTIMQHKEEYAEKYPFITKNDDNSEN